MSPMAAEVCLAPGQVETSSSPPVTSSDVSASVSTSSSHESVDLCDPSLQEEIAEVRKLFLEDRELNPDLYDEYDVNKIQTSDWYVARFLLRRHRDVPAAATMMRDCMRWRGEMGMAAMRDTDFPREFFQIGGIFSYETDHWGNRVIFLRIHMHRKISELQDAIKKFVIHTMNRVDVEVDGRGMAIVFDLSGAGIQNADMDFLWFLISTLRNYYPEGLAYVLVYELPWLLKSCWTMAKAWIPEDDRKLIKFASKKDVTSYIPRHNLPDYMGGTCERDYRAVPDGCQTAEEAAERYGFRTKDLKRLRDMFAEHLKK